MESDAENAQVDAVAKIIFWPYCSAAMELLISVLILHQHLVANHDGLNFLSRCILARAESQEESIYQHTCNVEMWPPHATESQPQSPCAQSHVLFLKD